MQTCFEGRGNSNNYNQKNDMHCCLNHNSCKRVHSYSLESFFKTVPSKGVAGTLDVTVPKTSTAGMAHITRFRRTDPSRLYNLRLKSSEPLWGIAMALNVGKSTSKMMIYSVPVMSHQCSYNTPRWPREL